MLTPDQVREFKEIYLKEYGIELSPLDAVDKANKLFNLFESFAKLNNNQISTKSIKDKPVKSIKR